MVAWRRLRKPRVDIEIFRSDGLLDAEALDKLAHQQAEARARPEMHASVWWRARLRGLNLTARRALGALFAGLVVAWWIWLGLIYPWAKFRMGATVAQMAVGARGAWPMMNEALQFNLAGPARAAAPALHKASRVSHKWHPVAGESSHFSMAGAR